MLRNLEAAGLLAIRYGTPRFSKRPDGQELQPCVSFSTASEELVDLAFEWIQDHELCRVDPIFLELKANNKESHFLHFEWDDYTRLVQKQISEYCEFVSHQHIMIEGKPLGELKLVRQFKDWAGDGSFLYSVESEYCFEQGLRIGRWRDFYNNQQLKRDRTYRNDLRIGKEHTYFENGVMQSEASYDDGVLQGLALEWHPNGILKRATRYVEGQIDGVEEF